MKIINRAAFLRLPEGTAYFKGDEWMNWEGLEFKGSAPSVFLNDWYAVQIATIESEDSDEERDRQREMLGRGVSYPIEPTCSRDGLFDDDATFLIPERDDLLVIRGLIDQAITATGEVPA